MQTLFNKFIVRIQNVKVFVAVVSGVLLVLSNTGVISVEHADHLNYILNSIFSVFVGLGVFANPEDHVSKQEVVKVVAQDVAKVAEAVVQVSQSPTVAPVDNFVIQPQAPVQAPVQPVPAAQPPVQG